MNKITVDREVLDQAIDALEASKGLVISEHRNMELQGNAAAMACLPKLEAAEKGHIGAIATLREALAQPQQAPAWWSAVENILDEYGLRAIEFVADFKAALGQPQQEPVAWMHEWADGERIPLLTKEDDRLDDAPKSVRPLVYGDTAPPARKPLTDEQIYMHCPNWLSQEQCKAWVRRIEAAHGIKVAL